MSTKTHSCLNCGAHLSGKFCASCGQNASTHRFTVRSLITHDLAHSMLHLERQFLHTLKELLIRPGHAIREYLQGQRIRHANFFSLLLIIILVLTWLEHITHFHYGDLTSTPLAEMESLEKFRSDHPKIFLIGVIPFFALFSFVLFRKAGQNYAEHFVLNAYKSCGTLLISTGLVATKLFTDDLSVIRKVNMIADWMILLYSVIFFYQYFSVFQYKKFKLILLSVACTTLPFLVIIILIEAIALTS